MHAPVFLLSARARPSSAPLRLRAHVPAFPLVLTRRLSFSAPLKVLVVLMRCSSSASMRSHAHALRVVLTLLAAADRAPRSELLDQGQRDWVVVRPVQARQDERVRFTRRRSSTQNELQAERRSGAGWRGLLSRDDWVAKDSLESDEYLYRINLCRPVLYTGNVNFTVPAETGVHQQRKDAPSRQHVVGKVGFPAVLGTLSCPGTREAGLRERRA